MSTAQNEIRKKYQKNAKVLTILLENVLQLDC